MKEFWSNQIALALIVFVVIVVGAYWMMGADAKEIIIQVITAVGALVTGGAIERSKNERRTDKEEPKP